MKEEMRRKREEIAVERENHHKMIQNMNGTYLYLFLNALVFFAYFILPISDFIFEIYYIPYDLHM